MIRKSSAVWNGTGKEGKGILTSTSGVLSNTPYSAAARFESEDGKAGTNPEELIAAAHAGCFSMALSAELGKVQITPNSIETSAVVSLAKKDEGFAVSDSKLTATVTAKGADRAKIELAAATAKENCPISKLLNAKISLALTVTT